MQDKQNIVIVWFKRDLRLHDNEAIFNALQSGNRILLLYVFEPLLLEDAHYDERHFNFIKQSLIDLNKVLKQYKTKVMVVKNSVISTLKMLQNYYHIKQMFSHQETGIMATFQRDKEINRFCSNNVINWIESINNGVFRGRENREHWVEDWQNYMKQPQLYFNPKEGSFIPKEEIRNLEHNFIISDLVTEKSINFQYGGRSTGLRYMQSFFKGRYVNYAKFISKPAKARESCSRLSPYLAWGNLSIREVFQYAKSFRSESKNKRAIDAFTSRLRWQAHFIQKFEMECIMETESLNKGFSKLKKSVSKKYQKAWQNAETGFPIIDACMRCLKTTGYLNFRMRAILVSFFTHNLWQPWQDASKFLSKQFLDFEPGIHFPQLQMQAGETGINTIRIYNPIKNGLEHDEDAKFILKWIPELKNLPLPFVHEPYKMTYLDQKFHQFVLGKDYPNPIIDIVKTRKRASDKIWAMRKDKEVQAESVRILNKHVINPPQ